MGKSDDENTDVARREGGMTKPRIVLADDHELVAAGIASLLKDEFELVAAVSDGEALVRAVRELKPDVALVDVSMPHLNGLDAARQVLAVSPETRVIFLTMYADPEYARAARAMGAKGFVLKQSAARELTDAIQEALAGRFYVASNLEGSEARPSANLTGRQRQVLQLVAEGLSVKQIGARMDLSEKTVEFHKRKLMDALDLRTTAELTKYAVARGLA
jgi:DNA-binding NarL/FixJ family response regulator